MASDDPNKGSDSPPVPQRAFANDLWSRAVDIWNTCRGLGWTLNSEKAVREIQKHLEIIEQSYQYHIDRLEHELKLSERRVRSLKKQVATTNKAHNE